MRRMIGVSIGVLLASSVLIGGGKEYGKKLTLTSPTAIASIFGDPDRFRGKRVLVEGEITEVCQKKGCWIKLKDEPEGKAIQVKVEDDVVVFPKDGKGRKIRAEGVVSVTVLTQEERRKKARHEAEEQGRLKEFDLAEIVGPIVSVRIEGEGAVIRD